MATVSASTTKTALEPEERFVLRNVGWSGYEALLAMIGDGHTRVTYDRGDAELMSPSHHHDYYKVILGHIVATITEELGIDCHDTGSTTWKKPLEDRGLEPDQCFYLKNIDNIPHKLGAIDLSVDPPPDLAIEIEITRSVLDHMGVYAALGIPEVWRFDGDTLLIERLGPDSRYTHVPASIELPPVSPVEIVHWVREAEGTWSRTRWNRAFREWVRAEVLPRWRGNRED